MALRLGPYPSLNSITQQHHAGARIHGTNAGVGVEPAARRAGVYVECTWECRAAACGWVAHDMSHPRNKHFT
jgi:hypothetical protein